MSLKDDVDRVMTCAPVKCPRQEACYRVAKYLLDNLLDMTIRESLDAGEVYDYAPDWENRNGFVPCRDD